MAQRRSGGEADGMEQVEAAHACDYRCDAAGLRTLAKLVRAGRRFDDLAAYLDELAGALNGTEMYRATLADAMELLQNENAALKAEKAMEDALIRENGALKGRVETLQRQIDRLREERDDARLNPVRLTSATVEKLARANADAPLRVVEARGETKIVCAGAGAGANVKPAAPSPSVRDLVVTWGMLGASCGLFSGWILRTLWSLYR